MPVQPGSLIAAGYTTTRAVLGDAIAMVRGDRYYTTDFTPSHLTAWGFQDCKRDPDNGGFGSEMPKLLMRTLPRHYQYNNIFSLFPFFTPSTMNVNLRKQGIADQYTFDRPVAIMESKVLNTFTAIDYVFEDGMRFKRVSMTDGSGDDNTYDPSTHSKAIQALFWSNDSVSQYKEWYGQNLSEKIRKSSWRYDGVAGKFFDLKVVVNAVAAQWVSLKMCGIPLKLRENAGGLFTEQEVYGMFAKLYSLEFLSVDDSEHAFSLRMHATAHRKEIHKWVSQAIKKSSPGIINTVFNIASSVIWPSCEPEYSVFLGRLASSGDPSDDLVPGVISLALSTSVNYAHATMLAVDFYLDKRREAERVHILQLLDKADASSDELLVGYVREAMRLNPQVSVWSFKLQRTNVDFLYHSD
jgi:linoleate 10R-lipoxygenase